MAKQLQGPQVRMPHHGLPDPLGSNSEIGRKLKQYYDTLVSDEVPDRFAELLSLLEKAEPTQRKT